MIIPGFSTGYLYRDSTFHSVIYFKDQVLHISQVYDHPAVLVWFEKPGMIDFKIYGEPIERSEKVFAFNYEDRGRDFQAAAVISEGQSYFQHQLVLDDYRSTYTRAHLDPGEFLVITGELQSETPFQTAKVIAGKNIGDIFAENEAKIASDLDHGKFTLKNHAEMQKVLDISRRVALSMQDFGGFMRSTNQYIYYLLWFRDGGMNTGHMTYTGWTKPTAEHVRMALLNPNNSFEEPKGKFYGQLMAGPITKWEEDGLFYVIWPAFNYWTQTGDDTYTSGKYLQTMEEAMDWLERYCYDEKKGLFGRYYYCETPVTGSRGDGYDNATGAPTYKWGSDYEGHTIVRTYDTYINQLNYANYMMLSSMCEGEKANMYMKKAINLEKEMNAYFGEEGLLPYGKLLTEKGDEVLAGPYGMDIWDYVWGIALPPFVPTQPAKYKTYREGIFSDMTTTEKKYFICVYNALLTSMDTEIHDEDSIMWAMEKLVPPSVRPGKYLPMPYSVPELINVEDGDPFHDVRPLVYSIAPWLSAVTNLGVRRLPFGIAVRGTKYLENIENYEYKKAMIDFQYEGKGEIEEIEINGKTLEGTLQVPENMLTTGDNHVLVKMGGKEVKKDLWISSTLQLFSLNREKSAYTYKVKGYGKNVIVFKNLTGTITVQDNEGNLAEVKKIHMGNLDYFEFPGRGMFTITLEVKD